MCRTKRKASWGQLLLCTSSPLWTSYVNMRIALLLPPWHRQEAESKLSTMGPRAAALPPPPHQATAEVGTHGGEDKPAVEVEIQSFQPLLLLLCDGEALLTKHA